MRKHTSLFLVLLLLSGLIVGSAFAQEATQEATLPSGSDMTPEATMASGTDMTTGTGMVTCDSDLILSLYIAERYFGFGTLRDQMTTSGSLDLDNVDKGQYAPLFDSMMGMNRSSSMMSSAQMSSMSNMMGMSDAEMQSQMQGSMPAGTDMSGMSMLQSSSMMDESGDCASLRAELRRFYTALAWQDLMGSSTSAEATAEAGASADMVNLTGVFSGPAEVPGPGDADAVGTATVSLDTMNSMVCYSIAISSVELPATAAHIHQAPVGQSGPPVVPLDVLPDASGNASSCVTADPAIVADMAVNPQNYYVNVHNSLFPDGAARAQLGGM